MRSAGPRFVPAAEWILVTSSAAAWSSGARIVGNRRAKIVLPTPRGETSLAEHHDPMRGSRRQASRRARQRQRDAELEPGAGLADRRGGEVHRDALLRVLEPR